MPKRLISALFLVALTGRWAVAAESDKAGDYQWNLPKGFPKPYVPADNPMSAAKVDLGRYLFYDTRMSVNGKESCASCHKQDLAFTDGRATGLGATGESHSRSAMSLVNVAWSGALTWSNPEMRSLEKQALVPMFGEHPVELGLREGDRFLPMLQSDAKYRALFEQAFPNETDRFTIDNVTRAIASFERSIISGRSPYDRYHYDRDDSAVSDAAKRGEVQFFDQRLSCFRCHGGFNFTDSTVSERNAKRPIEFHNTGLYNLPGLLSYPPPNVGIYEFTKAPADVGKFKAPTLRNIALTAPYMHDGSIPTLEGVLDHYAAGGRNGHNPNKDPLIGGFTISQQNRDDLIEFLKSLTDDAVIHDPKFANPWPAK
ncbi:MAG TPA: MbnH family di-heme enzyme [Bryobacteraceae bacterium]|jgi:cytochrome c peroxidase|nr:MbnH family di-heme enzyme [Bryobacteraceae bacterium]